MDCPGGKISVFGPVNVDVTARPVDFGKLEIGSQPMEDIRIAYGGDALNEAVVLRRLGAAVELVSRVGQDESGDRLVRFLEKEGISGAGINRAADTPTSVNIVLVDPQGERYFLTDPNGSMRRIRREDYLPFLPDAGNIICFPGMFVSREMDIPAMEAVFAEARKKPGRTLCADMTKAKNGEKLEDLRGLLPMIDYIFPNEAEAELLTGEADARTSARMFTEAGAGCAVIKRGARGCVIARQGEILELPAYPVARAVDTTGAGDAFAAGFAYALSRKMPLADCGLFASAAASCIVETTGANGGIRSAEEPMARFAEMKKRFYGS
jgi:sugar/nucleoside kinase (ribokinase family)